MNTHTFFVPEQESQISGYQQTTGALFGVRLKVIGIFPRT
jgi:hypothetical protein